MNPGDYTPVLVPGSEACWIHERLRCSCSTYIAQDWLHSCFLQLWLVEGQTGRLQAWPLTSIMGEELWSVPP